MHKLCVTNAKIWDSQPRKYLITQSFLGRLNLFRGDCPIFMLNMFNLTKILCRKPSLWPLGPLNIDNVLVLQWQGLAEFGFP